MFRLIVDFGCLDRSGSRCSSEEVKPQHSAAVPAPSNTAVVAVLAVVLAVVVVVVWEVDSLVWG